MTGPAAEADRIFAERLAAAGDERLQVLGRRHLTRSGRRVLEQEAARRGVAICPVDAENFPILREEP